MNDVEWVKFAQLLDASFVGDLEPGGPEEEALRATFGRVPWDLAAATVERLVLDGVEFLPKPGRLVSTLRRVVPDSTFGLAAALRGLSVPEYVSTLERPRELEAGPRRFDVLAAARAELAASGSVERVPDREATP